MGKFIAGLFVGAIIGFIIASLCAAAKMDEEVQDDV